MKLWTTIKSWSIWKKDWWKQLWKEINEKPSEMIEPVIPGESDPQEQNKPVEVSTEQPKETFVQEVENVAENALKEVEKPITAFEGILKSLESHKVDLQTIYGDLVAVVTKLDSSKVTKGVDSVNGEKSESGVIGQIQAKAGVIKATISDIRDVVNVLKELI